MFEKQQCIIRLSIAEFLCPELPVDFLLFLECNRRLCNRIAPNVGLIVCVVKIVAYRQKTVSIVTAYSDYEVICSVLLFKPEEGDIGIARLKEQEKKLGLVLSLSFFSDIHVSPSYFLLDTYFFQPNRQCWYVKAAESSYDGQPVYNKITSNCYVRFKVRDTLFPKLQYSVPASNVAGGSGSNNSNINDAAKNAAATNRSKTSANDAAHKPEMLVKAAVNFKMFGPIEMWMSPQQYNELYKPIAITNHNNNASSSSGGGAASAGGTAAKSKDGKRKFHKNKRKYNNNRGGNRRGGSQSQAATASDKQQPETSQSNKRQRRGKGNSKPNIVVASDQGSAPTTPAADQQQKLKPGRKRYRKHQPDKTAA